ncbi:hypothetical protein SAMN04488245_12343 [Alloyangia pacifica]|uniref:Uncharacterized protein n=1 Tax=Alloyangia pacifica TaxID=311180 RepID=A0A1I6WG40_9RHOB|nr:hypothetical protein SAMN04488245_12343 [Alloyangia pacifica]SFT24940.1 hypothetical protein SAMN04488050_12043 [Alloyangia pacifica]
MSFSAQIRTLRPIYGRTENFSTRSTMRVQHTRHPAPRSERMVWSQAGPNEGLRSPRLDVFPRTWFTIAQKRPMERPIIGSEMEPESLSGCVDPGT